MAKFSRQVVGSLLKSKDPLKPNYIKVKNDVSLKANDIIRAESKAFQLRSLDDAIAAGKLKEEYSVKNRERIENIPDFVIAELIILTNNEA